MKQDKTLDEVLYTLDETIFFCEQLKLDLSDEKENITAKILNDCFFACLSLCRLLNKLRHKLTMIQ